MMSVGPVLLAMRAGCVFAPRTTMCVCLFQPKEKSNFISLRRALVSSTLELAACAQQYLKYIYSNSSPLVSPSAREHHIVFL